MVPTVAVYRINLVIQRLERSGGISGSNSPRISNSFNILQQRRSVTTKRQDINDYHIPIKVAIGVKVVTSMDGSRINQVICPKITERFPIGHGTTVLPSFSDLIPSGIGLRITTGDGREGRLHSGPSDHFGRIIDEGQIGNSTSRRRGHFGRKVKEDLMGIGRCPRIPLILS